MKVSQNHESTADASAAETGGITNETGFVKLTPGVLFELNCPDCRKPVQADEWKLPGLWLLAKFHCKVCDAEFFHDLPNGLGVMTPCFLNIKTSKATAEFSGQWYADLTAFAWKNRRSRDVRITVERSNHGKKVCLVNCLFPWWGDAAGMLFRVNQLRDVKGMDVIVIINSALRWLVPAGIGGIWAVDQEFDANLHWNDGLDAAIKATVEKLGLDIFLPVVFQPPYLTQGEIHAACKIKPFPRDEWTIRLREKPTVTFMWREDRAWSGTASRRWSGRLFKKLQRYMGDLPRWMVSRSQASRVTFLARELKRKFPKMEFAVCGLGKSAVFPEWIKDMRVDAIKAGDNEGWAEQAARSHVLCGVTGSHLVIPGTLAGSYVELVPRVFWRNIMTCAAVNTREPRETLFCNRYVPMATSPGDLADMIASILLNFSYAAIAFKDAYYAPLSSESQRAIRDAVEHRKLVLQEIGLDTDELSS